MNLTSTVVKLKLVAFDVRDTLTESIFELFKIIRN